MSVKAPVQGFVTTQGFKECKNLFFKHSKSKREKKRNEFKPASKLLLDNFSTYLKKGDCLCTTCKRICHQIIHDRKKTAECGEVPKSIEDCVQNEIMKSRRNNLESIQNEDSNKECSPKDFSEVITEECSGDVPMDIVEEERISFSDEKNENDIEYRLNLSAQKENVKNLLNKLIDTLDFGTLKSIDFKNPKVIEETIDVLSTSLKGLLIKNYKKCASDKPNLFESTLIKELKTKLDHEEKVAEKIHILTIFPSSWSCRQIVKETGCTLYAAKASRKLREKKGILSYLDPPTRKRKITDDIIKTVKEFYCRNDISRLYPGSRDYVTVKNGTISEQIQKRLLLHNLKEIFALFKEEFPSIKISFAYFCLLRPLYCVFITNLSSNHNVCVCVHCHNIQLMLESLRYMKSKSKDIPTTYREIFTKMLCQNPTEDCRDNECFECPGYNKIDNKICLFLNECKIDSIRVKQWVHLQGKYEIIEREFTKDLFLKTLRDAYYTNFRKHFYTALNQSDFFRHLLKNLKEGELLANLDFAENYCVTTQDEIQSAYFGKKYITVHPFSVYGRVNGEIVHESLATIAESLQHNTAAVALFQDKFIDFVRNWYPNDVKKIYYFSDGAAAQYKNKSNFSNLAKHFNRYQIEAEWHFYASCHGKSTCDGIGGTLKRLARRASLQGKHISNSLELYEWAKNNLDNVSVIHCTQQEYEMKLNELSEQFANAKSVSGTRSFHAFIPVSRDNTNQLKAKLLSHSSKYEIVDVSSI